jgi:hypothetical protein
MCGPAVIPLILAAAAATVSTMSQFQQSKAQAAQYKREARVSRQTAVFESQRQQRDLKRQLARLQTATAASGVQAGSGSPLDLAAGFTAEAELEPMETIRQGLIQFQDLKFGAKRTKSAARANLVSGLLDVGASSTSKMSFFQS